MGRHLRKSFCWQGCALFRFFSGWSDYNLLLKNSDLNLSNGVDGSWPGGVIYFSPRASRKNIFVSNRGDASMSTKERSNSRFASKLT